MKIMRFNVDTKGKMPLVAEMIRAGSTKREIQNKTGLSPVTILRVEKFLNLRKAPLTKQQVQSNFIRALSSKPVEEKPASESVFTRISSLLESTGLCKRTPQTPMKEALEIIYSALRASMDEIKALKAEKATWDSEAAKEQVWGT